MGDGQEATNRTLPTMYNVQSRVTNHESCAFVINLLRTQADVAPRQKQFRVLSSLSLSLFVCSAHQTSLALRAQIHTVFD